MVITRWMVVSIAQGSLQLYFSTFLTVDTILHYDVDGYLSIYVDTSWEVMIHLVIQGNLFHRAILPHAY